MVKTGTIQIGHEMSFKEGIERAVINNAIFLFQNILIGEEQFSFRKLYSASIEIGSVLKDFEDSVATAIMEKEKGE